MRRTPLKDPPSGLAGLAVRLTLRLAGLARFPRFLRILLIRQNDLVRCGYHSDYFVFYRESTAPPDAD